MSSPCLLSRSSFAVAKVFMALCVFFCHVFEPFNNFGFLFVSVFFFISGFGMERGHRRFSALTRCVPLLFLFGFFTCLYAFVYQRFLFPTSWFLYVYFVLMVLYRFCPGLKSLFVSCFILALFFQILDFNWVWYASLGSFFFGVFFARSPSYFRLENVILFLPALVALPFSSIAFWGVLPLFAYLVLSISSLTRFRPISVLSPYTKYFYLCHVFCLGLFGATWTLGGSVSFIGVSGGFLMAAVLSFSFREYLFKYPKGA